MRKKEPGQKYKSTGYTYPPELSQTIRKLLDEHQLSGTISRLLAKEFNVKLAES